MDIQKIKVGDDYDRDELKDLLLKLKYQKTDFVEKPGQYALRGSVFDIYPITYRTPVRLEFEADTLASIRNFSLADGQSMTSFDEVFLIPITEKIERKMTPRTSKEQATIDSLERAIKTRKSVFKWFYWRLFSKDKVFITRVLVANGLKNSSKDSFNMLIEKVDNRLNLEHNLSKIKAQKWLQDFPANYRKIEVQNWFYFQKQAVSAAIIFASLRSFKSFLPVQKMFYEELRDRFTELLAIYDTIPGKLDDWTNYLTKNQIYTIATSPEQTDQIQKVPVD